MAIEVSGSFPIAGRGAGFMGIPYYIGTAEGLIELRSVNMDYVTDNPVKIPTRLLNNKDEDVGPAEIILHFNPGTGDLDWVDIYATNYTLGGLNYKK